MLSILGPTSTGKTDLALTLAKKFNGELVACDSRQVYKGLDIGTGKLPGTKALVRKGKGYWIINGVKVWMYDISDFRKQYTVSDYVKDANTVISDINKRGKLPIIVGGSGLYLKALLYGFSDLSIPVNLKLRKELEDLSLEKLQKKLSKLSLSKWESLNNSDKNNKRRLVRYIELMKMASHRKKGIGGLDKKFKILKIGLTAPKGILYKRIDERVLSRINQGMIKEAEKLHQKGLSFKRMKALGLEYGILADFLSNKISSQEELIKILQFKIHQYLKRQLTWFKKEKDTFWFDISKKDFLDKVEKKVAKWYHLPSAT